MSFSTRRSDQTREGTDQTREEIDQTHEETDQTHEETDQTREKSDQAPEKKEPRTHKWAYVCLSGADYRLARDAFLVKYLSLVSEVGPWTNDTLCCLYNYLIASIKLRKNDEAEEQCRRVLGSMKARNMHKEACFVSLEIILCTSYYLSGKTKLFNGINTTIRSRGDPGDAFARDQIDVLRHCRFTRKDCLVLWESSLELSVLVRLTETDYDNHLASPPSNRGLLRSVRGFIRRLTSFRTLQGSTNGAGLRALHIQRALRQASNMYELGSHRRSTSLSLSMEANTRVSRGVPPSAIVAHSTSIELFGAAVHTEAEAAEQRSSEFQLGEEVVAARYEDRDWSEKQDRPLPIPDELLDDAAIGLKHRSVQTTRSSVSMGQEPQNQLEVTAWAYEDDGDRKYSRVLKILLDDGAQKSCISDKLAVELHASVQEERDVQLHSAVGQAIEVLGTVMVGFSWNRPSGKRCTAKIKCYVVKNLQVAMLLSAIIIEKLEIRRSPFLLAPILFTKTSNQTKVDNAQKSKLIADAARASEAHDAEERKAARDKLEQMAARRPNPNQKPRATAESLLGGSDTSRSSTSSSLTRLDRSASTTPSDESTRSGTSIESPPHRKRSGSSMGHRQLNTINSLNIRLYN